MMLDKCRAVYMMGIGGIAMGTLATMLKEKGFEVSGSDQNLYPPMSTHLESLRIPIFQPYAVENIQSCTPDVVVVGNVIRRTNPEVQFVLDRGIPYCSMPEAIERFFLPEHQSIVVAGTHGKSTTSSLMAWVLTHAGLDPSAFIGAFLKDWHRSYRLGQGPYMVIEGDEYDTAFFDKGPKFLHYRPHIGLLTSIEYDHADIFPDFEAVRQAFRRFVALIPESGYLIVNADDPHCVALSRECRGRVITYGWSLEADWGVHDVAHSAGAVHFTYRSPDFGELRTMESLLPGRHNLGNTLAVMAASAVAGLSMEQVQEAILAFGGVKRRQDVLGEHHGILVMDDFAHHPTAVRATIQALRPFYPDRRLIAVFEPRTNSSRRQVFQSAYEAAFDEADLIYIKQPPGLETIAESERLDAERLVRGIRQRGKEAYHFNTTEELLRALLNVGLPGDLMLCMSNGSFDGLPQKLVSALKAMEQSR